MFELDISGAESMIVLAQAEIEHRSTRADELAAALVAEERELRAVKARLAKAQADLAALEQAQAHVPLVGAFAMINTRVHPTRKQTPGCA